MSILTVTRRVVRPTTMQAAVRLLNATVRPAGVAGLLLLIGVTAIPAQDRIELERVVLKVTEQVRIPAQDAGVLQELKVREGDVIARGQVFGKVDDAAARLAVARAQSDVRLAQHVAKNALPLDLARKAVDQAVQSRAESEILQKVADQTALDDTHIQAAVKQHGVAVNELQRHISAKERSADSVSESKIDGLQLMADKADLEAQHARLQHELDILRARAQTEAVKRLNLAVDEAKLDVDNASAGLVEAGIQADLKLRDLEIAQHLLDRRQLKSPVEGVVVEVLHQAGEWVEPGEAVLRVLQVNRLRAEGFVTADRPIPGLLGAPALIRVPQGTGAQIERTGKVVFVNPEVDPVNNQRRVWIEFDNADLQLLPGMLGSVTISLAPKNG